MILTWGLKYYKPPSYFINKHPKTADINEDFGAWHIPNTQFIYKKKCFSTINKYNSYGARDVERKKQSNDVRIINIGDSFMEGYGVNTEVRFSDILEKKTGKEVLNFSTSGGFGSTQMRLLYESLASEFEHDIVLLGLFPANDFDDDNFELGQKIFKNRYRPYLVDGKLIYHVKDIKESGWHLSRVYNKSKIQFFSEVSHLGSILYQVLYIKPRVDEVLRIKKEHFNALSRFQDFTDDEIEILKSNLKLIKKKAGVSRDLIIFAIPSKLDLIRFHKNKNIKDNLTPILKKISSEINIVYIDMLGEILSSDKSYEEKLEIYFDCDGHWSPKGHHWAAELAFPFIEGSLLNLKIGNEKPQ